MRNDSEGTPGRARISLPDNLIMHWTSPIVIRHTARSAACRLLQRRRGRKARTDVAGSFLAMPILAVVLIGFNPPNPSSGFARWPWDLAAHRPHQTRTPDGSATLTRLPDGWGNPPTGSSLLCGLAGTVPILRHLKLPCRQNTTPKIMEMMDES